MPGEMAKQSAPPCRSGDRPFANAQAAVAGGGERYPIGSKGSARGSDETKLCRHGWGIVLSPTRVCGRRTAGNAIPSGQRVPPEEAAKQSCAAMPVGGTPFRRRASAGGGERYPHRVKGFRQRKRRNKAVPPWSVGSAFRQRAGRGRGRRGTLSHRVKGFRQRKRRNKAVPPCRSVGSAFRQRAGRGRGRRTEARKEGSKGFAVQKASQGNALFPQFEHDVLFAGAFKAAMLVKLVGAAAVRIQVKAAVRFPARKLIEQ